MNLVILAALVVSSATGQARGVATTAAPVGYPRSTGEWAAFLAPDPRFMEIGSIPEPMPTRKLAEAGLVASGVPTERMEYYIGRLWETFEALRTRSERIQDPALRAESILPFLHRSLFKKYQADMTTVDAVVDTGYFNCVSSAVVYLLAARVFVLPMKGVQTPDHAFCVLTVGGRDIDVETTNPFGFDPGTSKRFISSFTKTTQFSYVPPGDYARRKTITEKDLVGLILHNRAVEMNRQGKYLEALRLAVDRTTGFPGPDSYDFLADTASNVCADLDQRGDMSGSLAVAEHVLALAGARPKVQELHRVAVYNFVADAHNRFAGYYNARDYARAHAVVEEALRRLPDDPTLLQDLSARQP
ncbi:MAG: hypothetical protein CVV51_13635 [Spirochaetae bacterium HGW-Spirochaetae-7]|nr:MAG: hypothetical protein CVV51_13635 [Spirochaetae bacterium HGW-Spirochaetae-7]